MKYSRILVNRFSSSLWIEKKVKTKILQTWGKNTIERSTHSLHHVDRLNTAPEDLCPNLVIPEKNKKKLIEGHKLECRVWKIQKIFISTRRNVSIQFWGKKCLINDRGIASTPVEGQKYDRDNSEAPRLFEEK